MNGKWTFLNDGILESALSTKLREMLDKRELLFPLSKNRTKALRFTGFLFVDGGWVIVFPKTFVISNNLSDNLFASSLLFKVLVKYFRTESSSPLGSYETAFEDIEDKRKLTPLSMYDFLLEDWGQFGQYQNLKKRSSTSLSGNINWKKTISVIEPLTTTNGIPVFSRFIITRNDYSTLEKISLLQKWAVATADSMIGWLLSPNHRNLLLYPELKQYAGNCPIERSIAIQLIKSELHIQYNTRKILLLKTILTLIEESPFTECTETMPQLGVKFFWPIWEKMCKFILSDESTIHSEFLPYPVYLTSDLSKYPTHGLFSQRPDIIFRAGNSLIVVDAKYYDIEQGLPGWGDIVKQLFYEKSFKAVDYSPNIKNFFLFPRPKSDCTPSQIDVRNPNEGGSRNDKSVDEFAKIICLYYDIRLACIHYIENTPDNEFKHLIGLDRE